MPQTETKQEVLSESCKFMSELFSLWNKKADEFGQPEQKITKEDICNELKKEVYEI